MLDFSKPPYAPMNLVFGGFRYKCSYASSRVARILHISLLKIKHSFRSRYKISFFLGEIIMDIRWSQGLGILEVKHKIPLFL